MARKIMCDFCGARADMSGDGDVLVRPNRSHQSSYDACHTCLSKIDALLKELRFGSEQPSMELPEYTGRSVSEIQSDIEVFESMEENEIGRLKPERVEKILTHLRGELSRAQAGEEVSRDDILTL